MTDLAAQEWCEQELAFTLAHGRVETAAMAAGTARHAQLEAEVLERVEVAAVTLEDRWALRALNIHVGLAQLRETGMTRELPVFGWILDRNGGNGTGGGGGDTDDGDGGSGDDVSDGGGAFAVGIIDELWLTAAGDEDGDEGSGSCGGGGSGGSVRIVDHKTRVRATLPTDAQARTTHLQLMAYKALYDGMVTRGLDPLRREAVDVPQPDDARRSLETQPSGAANAPGHGGRRLVCLRLGLDPDRQLSHPIVAHVATLGLLDAHADGAGRPRCGVVGGGEGDNGDGRGGCVEDLVEEGGGGGEGGEASEARVAASSSPLTLGDVFDAVSQAAKVLPRSSDTLYVDYEWQRDGSVIGQSSFAHDADWLERRVGRHLTFWNGTRRWDDEGEEKMGAAAVATTADATGGGDPHFKGGVFGVSDDEAWKCERCRFSADCPTAAVFAERWRAARQPPQM